MGKGECCVSALAEIRRRADFHCEQGDGSFWLNPEIGEAVPNRRGVGVSNFRSRPATAVRSRFGATTAAEAQLPLAQSWRAASRLFAAPDDHVVSIALNSVAFNARRIASRGAFQSNSERLSESAQYDCSRQSANNLSAADGA